MATAQSATTEAVAAIEKWYELAAKAMGLMRHLSIHADDQITHSVSWAANDPDDPPSPEHVENLFKALLEARKIKADGIQTNAEHLLAVLGALNTLASEQVWSRYELAYCELGDFRIGEFAGGRWAWNTIQELGYKMSRWAMDLSNLWASDVIDAANSSMDELFYSLRQRCPFTEEIENALRQRLTLEKSRLLRDATHPPPTCYRRR